MSANKGSRSSAAEDLAERQALAARYGMKLVRFVPPETAKDVEQEARRLKRASEEKPERRGVTLDGGGAPLGG